MYVMESHPSTFAFSILTFVVLYATVISCGELVCSVITFTASPKPLVLVFFGECHTEASRVVTRCTTAVYTYLDSFRVDPLVEAGASVIGIVCEAIFPGST